MLFAPARSLDAQSGISVFFCCIVTAGFHISRLTWEIPWEFLGPMAYDDPNMDGIIDQHFDHFSSALLSTFTQTSKHQKCWHANLADTVTTCYNILQPTSICWLNPDVRKSEFYPILVGYVPFFCGKIMQHHVKSPCWYPVDIHIFPFTKPLFNSAHGWLNGMKTKPPMIAYSWHLQKGCCQWSSLLSGTTKYVYIYMY